MTKNFTTSNRKRIIFISSVLFVLVSIALFTFRKDEREEYEDFLNNHSFNQRAGISHSDLKKIPKRDRPDLAWEQDYLMTMDPALKRPVKERLLPVYDDVKRFRRAKAGIPGDINNSWVERGPNNIGGRVRAIMFDPNDSEHKKVWAGAVSGGLWYTDDITDENISWNAVGDAWQNLAISTIAYDPSNPQIFYVGTGEGWLNLDAVKGLGVWKTTDGGSTWNRLASTSGNDFKTIQKIVVTNSGKVLVGTNRGIFVSSDKGNIWDKKETGFISDLEIAADGTIYAGKGRSGVSGGVFKSSDQGETWTDITPNGTSQKRVEIAVSPSNSQAIYAVAAGGDNISWFKKSTNGGSTWSDVQIPKYMTQRCKYSSEDDFAGGQHWYNLILAVHPDNENIVIAGGIDLNKSTDGGNTWSIISYWTGACANYVHADQHAIAFRPGHNDEAVFGNDGGIAYSPNAGSSSEPKFIIRNQGFNVTQYYSCAIHPDANKNYYLGGSQDNGSHQLQSLGVGSGVEVTGGDGAFSFIDAENPQIQITSYTNNNYYCSKDGGSTFSNIQSSETGRFINPADYDSKFGILYSGRDKDYINRITNIKAEPKIDKIDCDLGAQASNFLVSPYSTESSILFVGTQSGRLFKIRRANTNNPTIKEIGDKKFPTGNISCIQLGNNEKEILVTFSNYGVTSIWYTSDGGSNWVIKEGDLPDMPVRWAMFNPNNRKQVILATEVGVWATKNFDDNSPTWTPSNSGLANVRVDMFRIRKSDNQVVAATHGRGLFTSNAFSTINYNELNAFFSTKRLRNIGLGVDIQFEDLSTGEPDAWEWTFEGGSPASSNEQNPVVKYSQVGTYKVILTVKKAGKSRTITREDFINVSGETGWTEQATAFDAQARGIDYIDIVDRKIVWANAFDGSGDEEKIKEFTKTTDGGNTWHSNTYNIAGNVSIAMISAVNENVAWVPVYPNESGADCGIYKTTDGGNTWNKQSTAAFSGSDAFANVVYFWDENTGFCMGDPNGGYFEIYTTTDGGTNWKRVPSSKIPNARDKEFGTVGHFCVAEDGTVFFNTTKGRIFKSTDKGNTWTAIETGFSGANKCAFADSKNGVAFEVTKDFNNKVIITHDGGKSWKNVDSTNVFFSNLRYVPGTDKMYVTTGASADKSGASFSVDGGETWTRYQAQDGNQCLAVDFYDVSLGWFGQFNQSKTIGGILKYTSSNIMPDFKVKPETDNKVEFIDITLGGNSSLTYSWDFGEDADPNTANTQGPHKVKYEKLGSKTVKLTVNNFSITKKINISIADKDVPEEPESTGDKISIFPNPSSGEININVKPTEQKELYSINIYKSTGKVVYKGQINSGEKKTLNLSQSGKGIYLVKIFNDKKSETYKVMII